MGTPDLATSELVALPSTRLLGSGRAVVSVHHPLLPWAMQYQPSATAPSDCRLTNCEWRTFNRIGRELTLCLTADLATLQGKLASCAPRSSVPGMCRAQIGCAMNVPWCGWGEGWRALQVVDY